MASQSIVNFNIGGTRYSTSISSIMKYLDSMLAIMIQQEKEKRMIQAGQELFIDRNGLMFEHVLEYLRNGDTMVLPNDMDALHKLTLEADFFKLAGLAALVSKKKSCFEVGDYVSLDVWVADLDNHQVTKEVLKKSFTYSTLNEVIKSCPHKHASKGAMATTRLMNIKKPLESSPGSYYYGRRYQWIGKIKALSDDCANVKFYHEEGQKKRDEKPPGQISGERWVDIIHRTWLLLHVPTHILKKI